MDELTFKAKKALGLYSDSIDIFINGKNLIEMLKTYELPHAIKEGHPDIAGQYMGIGSRELFERLSKPGQDKIIFTCNGCGEEGCWPMIIDIQADEHSVTWSNFRQPHRGSVSKASYWDYSGFPTFTFDKIHYEAALASLKNSSSRVT